MIHISPGNSKLGKCANISLPPGRACGKAVPCFTCKGGCYAKKSYRMYPSTKKAWDDNLAERRKDVDKYYNTIEEWIITHEPEYFRWHVAGDFLEQRDISWVASIALHNPLTQFLAYTKRHDLVTQFAGGGPENLTIIRSMWPGWGTTVGWTGPVAWVQNGEEPRIPANAFICPGKCGPCGYMCWGLEGDVVFNVH